MHRNTWKAFERRVAAMFGTKRTPLSGGNSGHTRSDSLHKELFIECKKHKRMAMHNLFRSTKELAELEEKTPIIITQEPQGRTTLITLDIKDLKYVAERLEE